MRGLWVAMTARLRRLVMGAPVVPVAAPLRRPRSVACDPADLWRFAEALPVDELAAYDEQLGAYGYDPNGRLRQRVRSRLHGLG